MNYKCFKCKGETDGNTTIETGFGTLDYVCVCKKCKGEIDKIDSLLPIYFILGFIVFSIFLFIAASI